LWRIDLTTHEHKEMATHNACSHKWANCTQMELFGENLYLIPGRAHGGCTGLGHLYKIDLNTETQKDLTPGEGANARRDAIGMVQYGGFMYTIRGKKHGCQGTGGLWRTNVSTGLCEEIQPNGWANATHMLEHNGNLFVICGQGHSCNGGGGLYKIDLKSEGKKSFQKIGESGWRGATCVIEHEGSMYIVCGKKHGCQGAGGLYRVDMATGEYQRLGPVTWANATQMIVCQGDLYIVCGQGHGGCTGSGGLYRVKI
jgi:hypothetical protein